MDANSLLTLSLHEVSALLERTQRSGRLSALICKFEDLQRDQSGEIFAAQRKLSYLFRQSEFPKEALLSADAKDSTTRILKEAYLSFSQGWPIAEKPKEVQFIDGAQRFSFLFLSNMMPDKVELSAFVLKDGKKQWFAQLPSGNDSLLASISFGSKGVEIKRYEKKPIEEKGISLLPGNQKEIKNHFLKEFNTPPSKDACDNLVRALSFYAVPRVNFNLDRLLVLKVVEQIIQDPLPQYIPFPKHHIN